MRTMTRITLLVCSCCLCRAQFIAVGSTNDRGTQICVQNTANSSSLNPSCMHSVYETKDVDNRISTLNTMFTSKTDALTQTLNVSTKQLEEKLNKNVSEAEARIQGNLVKAINQLPQRLLSDAAEKEITDSIRAEIKADIDQVRKELQQQIDELKRNNAGRTPNR